MISVPVFAVFFWKIGLYRGMWRFASVPDLVRIIKSVAMGTLFYSLLVGILFRFEGIPRSTLFVFPMILASGLAGPRLLYRVIKDKSISLLKAEGKQTLVIGAGHAGEQVVREFLNCQEYQPVAILDDDPRKFRREVHGVRVYGDLSHIADLVKLLNIDLVLFAIPTASRSTVASVIQVCSEIGVECRTLPTLTERIVSSFEVSDIRPFTLEDLLSREVVQLENEKVATWLKGVNVLVTGAGGSIGSELCRQIALSNPAMLILLEQSEFNLYNIDRELRCNFPDVQVISVLGDIKNRVRVNWVFEKFLPRVVFHAAAYKHVPMVELNPAEGVQNNVHGTRVVAEASDKYGVEKFVLVSTDKAVNPVNIMGASKRVAELFCQNFNELSETIFLTTRFGNVLGSTGSVVPLFEQQIKSGGPITVTHPEINRYFMTTQEAVSLILHAGAIGKGGEIFVLDMGEPVLIRDLAEQMIRIAGLEPGKDIHITYTGLRPGEKLFEEWFHENENLENTPHPKLLLASSRQVEWQWLLHEIEALSKAATFRDVGQIVARLCSVVPEYSSVPLVKKVVND
nr:nucleoside-diphosphate sugar epimerase/dehydratase [Desulfogranum marinum]